MCEKNIMIFDDFVHLIEVWKKFIKKRIFPQFFFQYLIICYKHARMCGKFFYFRVISYDGITLKVIDMLLFTLSA